MGTCAHSGDLVGDRKLESNVFYILNLIESPLILFHTIAHWFTIVTPVGGE